MREVARLVTLVERDDPDAVAERAAPLAAIESNPPAPVVGFTGAPGVGKSTLLGALASSLAAGSERRIAIVAVDPSSAVTGGALLGDRTRIRVPERRVFIRSQASQAESGGLAPTTYPVVRVLRRLFDLVLVETLGVGQSEDDIRHVADATYLLLQPLAGDSVQHLKAGLMEAPDVIVVTKCDVADLAHRGAGRPARCDRPGPAGRDDPVARGQRTDGCRHRRAGRRGRRDAGRTGAAARRLVRDARRPDGARPARCRAPGRTRPGFRWFAGRAPGRGARPILPFVRLSPPHPASRPAPRRCAAPASSTTSFAMPSSRLPSIRCRA